MQVAYPSLRYIHEAVPLSVNLKKLEKATQPCTVCLPVIQFCSPRKKACFLIWILLSPGETPAEIFVSSCTHSVVSVPIIVIIK